MRGVRSAAAVAKHKDLTILLQRLAEHLNQLRHRRSRDRVQGRLLGSDIVLDPVLHAKNPLKKVSPRLAGTCLEQLFCSPLRCGLTRFASARDGFGTKVSADAAIGCD